MKNLITLLAYVGTFVGVTAQTSDGPGRNRPTPTPEILALNSQELALKASDDVEGLQQNRLAQIAAWQKVDPTIAAEYETIKVPQNTATNITGSSKDSAETLLGLDARWGNDLQINPYFVNDGVDMDLALDGTIYIASYINKVGGGGNFDEIYIYKSINNGLSFSLWGTASTPDNMTKMKLTLMDKGTTKYLFITYSAANGNLQNLRFNLAGGSLTSEIIATNIKLFDIDVDYEFAFASQLYAVYTKSDDGIYSARSAANSTGTGWADEHYLGYGAKEIAFTYGKGSTFVSFIGYLTGNHYFIANSGYNSPTGWTDRITLQTANINETKYISLRAERKPYSQFRVVSIASRKQNSPTISFRGIAEIINANGSIDTDNMAAGASSVINWDSWCQKVDGNTNIKTSFQILAERSLNILNYSNNGNWDAQTIVSDNQVLTHAGNSAVAGDANNNSIALYVSGTSNFGLYFDSNRAVMAVNEYEKNTVKFYPNPVESTLHLTSKEKMRSIIISNMVGQKLKTFKPDSTTSVLDLSDLTSGIYLMQVNVNGIIENNKVIKK